MAAIPIERTTETSRPITHRMMRILCVTPSYWPAFQYGGTIFVNHYLNRALVKKGIEVTVYTTSVGLENKVQENREVYVDGVRVIYFSISKALDCLGATGWQFSWPMTRALRENLHRFDLLSINAIWNYPSIAAVIVNKAYHVPYIVTAHGALYPYALSKKWWKKLPYYHLVAKRVLEGAAAIHYTGEDEAEKCHPHLGLNNRAVVVPCVIDLSEFGDNPDRDALRRRYPALKGRKTILFLSRINWKKGLDILIKAFAMVAKQQEDVHLLIVGDDESGYGEQVRRWIRDCGMSYEDQGSEGGGTERREKDSNVRITFAGMLTGKEKVQAYAGSDMFVLPSYSENFGIVVVEAMACGIPVIVSDQVGIHKEVTESKAGIVIEPDADELARAIMLLLHNPELCKEMGRNGQQSVEDRFALDKVVDSTIEIYQGLMKC